MENEEDGLPNVLKREGGLAKDEITLLRREHEMYNKARTWTLVGGALLFL